MITIVAHMTVPDRDAATEIESASASFVSSTRDEPGCVEFRLHRALDEPGAGPREHAWYETFADQAAVDAHVASDHVAGWFALLARLGASNDYRLYERISR